MSEEATLDDFGSTSGDNTNDWSEERLRNLIEKDEAGVWGDEASGDGVRVLRATNYAPDKIDLSDVAIRDIPDSKKNSKKLKSGDIVVERSGGSANQPVGRVLFFDLEGEYYHGNFLRQLRPDTSKVNAQYLYYRLDYDYKRGHTKPLQTNTTNIRNLQYDSYLNQNISCPPKSQQRKITTVLNTVDRAIEKSEQIRKKAKEVEEASKTELFTHGYSEWELGESVGWRSRANKFPKDWKIKPAEELMNITRGASPRPRSDDSLFGGEIPWIKIGDAEQGISKTIKQVNSYVTEKGKEKSKFVEEDTLLVANSGATCGFSVFAGLDGCVHDGWLILRDYDGFVPDFLYHYINWNYNYLQSLSLGSAQTNLSTGLFGRLDIPIPPIQEQQQIVETLDSINRVASNASKETVRLKRLKRGLQQDLLSGTVSTADTNIEVPDEIAQHG